MASRPRLFWDTSAIVAAIMSPRTESATRQLLRLGEASVVDHRLSSHVLSELEHVLGKRAPGAKADTALILDQAQFVVVPEADPGLAGECEAATRHRQDARVLAAAVQCAAEVLVTLDAQHLLGNPRIGAMDPAIEVVAPGEALGFCRQRLLDTADEA